MALTSSVVFPKVSTTDYCQRQDTEPGRLANIATLFSSGEQIEHLELVYKQSNLGY